PRAARRREPRRGCHGSPGGRRVGVASSRPRSSAGSAADRRSHGRRCPARGRPDARRARGWRVPCGGARVGRARTPRYVPRGPGAQVELVVERGDDGYVVRVSDDGPGTSDLRGAGFGLDGLSERVAACEGSFRAGPGAQGGFLVEAVLPVSALREVRG